MQAEAKPRTTDFVAPACKQCEAIRPDGTNYTRVYNTHRSTKVVVRYCKCHYCNNTFKVVSFV